MFKKVLLIIAIFKFLFISILNANIFLDKEDFPYKIKQENGATVTYELHNMEWNPKTYHFYTYYNGGSKNHAKLYDKDMNLIAESNGDYFNFKYTFNNYHDETYFLEIDNIDDKTPNGYTLYISTGKDTNSIQKANFPLKVFRRNNCDPKYSFIVDYSSTYKIFTTERANVQSISILELPDYNIIKKVDANCTEGDWWCDTKISIDLKKSKKYLMKIDTFDCEADWSEDDIYTINLVDETLDRNILNSIPAILYLLD